MLVMYNISNASCVFIINMTRFMMHILQTLLDDPNDVNVLVIDTCCGSAMTGINYH